MKRPEQHITDSQADAIFRNAFSEWAVTPSERDYGWDYVDEILRNNESTGLLFDAQLKGSRHTEYSADGTFISQTLEQDAADYLARQLQQPTFLFHADVNAKKLFGSAIQLDQSVLGALEQGKTKSLTVRIPTASVLPDGMERFLIDLTQSRMVVISRILMGTRPIDFVDAMAGIPLIALLKSPRISTRRHFIWSCRRRTGSDRVGILPEPSPRSRKSSPDRVPLATSRSTSTLQFTTIF